MNDRTPELEEKLRAALRARSDRAEPASDSYLRLQHRLAERAPGPHRRVSLPQRYLAAAAALLVAVASAAVLMSQQQRSNVEAIGGTTTSTPEPVRPTSTRAAVVPEPVVTPTTARESEYVPTPVAGPRAATVEEAALAFLDLLDIDHAGLEVDGLRVGVRAHTEDRQVGAVQVWLEVVETESGKGSAGFSVMSATSGSITITSPAVGSENTRSPLVVAGEGEGFEGSLGISFVSASDGSVLASTATTAGTAGVSAPFAAELEVSGAERGWVVVASPGAADNVFPPFSAIPISFVVDQDPVEYVVADVSADHPDGGLQLRDVPGTGQGAVVAVLPHDASGIRRVGQAPALVDDEVWWKVVVEIEGEIVRGWVNRRYLADPAASVPPDSSAEPITDEALSAIAQQFLRSGFDRDLGQLRELPWAEEVEIGWIRDPGPVSRDDLASDDFWTAAHPWALPEELGEPELRLSLLSLLDLPAPTNTDIAFELDADPVSPFALDRAAFAETVADVEGSARAVTIFDMTPDTSWRHTTLLLKQGAGGPEIVAVLLTVWIP